MIAEGTDFLLSDILKDYSFPKLSDKENQLKDI